MKVLDELPRLHAELSDGVDLSSASAAVQQMSRAPPSCLAPELMRASHAVANSYQIEVTRSLPPTAATSRSLGQMMAASDNITGLS